MNRRNWLFISSLCPCCAVVTPAQRQQHLVLHVNVTEVVMVRVAVGPVGTAFDKLYKET
jgi:hypothetical protein